MIKFLISFLILLNLFSCQEIKEKKIASSVNKNIKKIEKIIENSDLKKNTNNKKNKLSDSIFYYVGEPYFIEGVKYIPEENYNYSEIGLKRELKLKNYY